MFGTFRWTRTHTIWLLMVVALIPALLVRGVFDGWDGAPAIMRWTVVVAGLVGTLASVYLIVARRPDQTSD